MGQQAYDLRATVEAKTTAYSVTAADGGKIFTNRGASGSVTFTLPAVSAAVTGMRVWFYAVAAQNLVVAGTAGELVTFNDAAANSAALQTGSEIIGGCIEAVCDGTSWLIILHTEETQTVTVAT